MDSNGEFSLVTITAVMHHYIEGQWIIVGPSRVGIYNDLMANSFRIVGRKVDTLEVVANCAINESFCYNKATPTFHQWRDGSQRVFGVKFASMDEATIFGDTLHQIIESFEKVWKAAAQENSTFNMEPRTEDDDTRLNGGVAVTDKSYQRNNSVDTIQAEEVENESMAKTRPTPPPPPPPPPSQKPTSIKPQPVKMTSTPSLTNGHRLPASKPATTTTTPSSTMASTLPSRMINDLQQKLAKRRAKIDESLEATSTNGTNIITSIDNNNNQTRVNKNDLLVKRVNPKIESANGVSSPQLERLKEEILTELRQELNLFKSDLLQTIREEIHTRLK